MKFKSKVTKVFDDGKFQVEGEGYKYYIENQSGMTVKPNQVVLLDCFLDDDCDEADGYCFISERPCELHLDENGSLHNEDGPALKYPPSEMFPNGCQMNYIHGVIK